jgi:hypothetical protein
LSGTFSKSIGEGRNKLASPARASDLLSAADAEVKAAAKLFANADPEAIERLRSASRDLERCQRLKDLENPADNIFDAACWWFQQVPDEKDLPCLEELRTCGRLTRHREDLLDRVIRIIRNQIISPRVAKAAEALIEGSCNSEFWASQLHQLGVDMQEHVLPRGSLLRPAAAEFPPEVDVARLVARLDSVDSRTRCELVLALGVWGGTECVEKLASIALSSDQPQTLREHCITGLRAIGGQQASTALCTLTSDTLLDIRYASIDALEDLITGGRPDYTVAPERPDLNPEEEIVRKTSISLQKIADDESLPGRLRRRASEVLEYLPTSS